MFWLGKKDDKYQITVNHVNGTIIGRGDSIMWGSEHPFSWDKLGEAQHWLSDKLEGRTDITTIKEKFGSIRIYGFMHDGDASYLQVLSELIAKFPGVQDYMTMCDGIPSLVVFSGTQDEREAYCDNMENKSDVEILATASEVNQ